MRLTDMLMTETARPCLDDPVFTGFADLYSDTPVVIDATDPYTLFVQMTMGREDDDDLAFLRDGLEDEGLGLTAASQISEFFHFDWKGVIGCIAPPYTNFVIEIDNREGMERAAQEIFGIDARKWAADLTHIGKTAVAFTAMSRDQWMTTIQKGLLPGSMQREFVGPGVDDLAKADFRWIYVATTWRYEPGRGLRGPASTFLIPLDADGMLLYIDPTGNPDLPLLVSIGPQCDESRSAKRIMSLPDQYALSQGWAVLVPALFALSMLHTPRSTKDREGYHDLLDGEMPKDRIQRKYLERNFRPMVTWRTLDITPLREAIKRENGGTYPDSISGLRQALHTVRGHSATYMPNTYFGRKHDQPITVFRPAYVRGDARAGVIQKEYNLNA